ncbi:Ger(x)C family spore germination protein [Paenibacillus monticola]|uniref:Ger(X)C family spore germination protein n=1 Tax=Paenibacillus monticola TaxID=2666075 RepID=A0A7X2H1M9_9BACL|nr:Ger(x)C family spore germination protein [Paenibacillus monticola]MRN51904.1 Ger(x)C family spore germination protein [Paenibacillus monticola]
MKNKIFRRISLLIILSLMSGMLVGCWDQLEIEDRALLLGLSIDKAPADDGKDDLTTHIKNTIKLPQIRVTAQIAVPGRVPLGPGGGDSGGGGNQNPVWVVQVYGYTLDDALNNLQQQISDPRYLIHLRVIIISEELARSNLDDLNDYLRRNPEVRRRIWLLVSEGDASKFMYIQPPLQRVPTLYILAMMEKSVESGKCPANYLGEFWTTESKWGQSGNLPYIGLGDKENVIIKGLAYFSGGAMVGSTTPIELGAYMGIRGIDPGGYSVLFDSPHFGPVMIKIDERFSKSKAQIKNGKPHITYNIFLDTSLDEQLHSSTPVSSSHSISELEKSLNQYVTKNFYHAILQSQQAHSDIFGMGEKVRAHCPSFWRANIHDKSDWERMYSDITVDFKVKVSIRRVGLKQK